MNTPGSLRGRLPKAAPSQAIRQAYRLVRGQRRRLALITLFSFVGGLAQALVLVIIVRVGVELAGDPEVSDSLGVLSSFDLRPGQLLGVGFGLAALMLVLDLASAHLSATLASGASKKLRRQIFTRYSEADWAQQSEERDGHLQELMIGASNQAADSVLNLATLTTALTQAVALLGTAVVVNPPAALSVLLALGALVVVLRPLSARGRAYNQRQAARQVDFAGHLAESVTLAQEIRTFDVGEAVRGRVAVVIDDLHHLVYRKQLMARIGPALFKTAALFVVLGVISIVYAMGASQLGELSAVVLVMVRSLSFGQTAQETLQRIQAQSPWIEQIDLRVDQLRRAKKVDGTEPLGTISAIRFDHVSFHYRPDAPVLSQVSFEVNAGEAIGIVGRSGAGKSTLVQLLLRLRAPTEGRYLVNGQDASSYQLEEWYRRVAFVPQDPKTLRGTVRENIAFLRDVPDADIDRAVEASQLAADVGRWPDGLDTDVGERGGRLSGGQRQRLALARALATGPEVLILDEPTSAVDPVSEGLITQSLHGLRGQVTVLIVAHRFSTLDICDRIMAFEGGRLEAFAPAAELSGLSSYFDEAERAAAR